MEAVQTREELLQKIERLEEDNKRLREQLVISEEAEQKQGGAQQI